jgi:hypothetical protein
MKSSLTTSVPKPKNQGGHGSSEATTQKTKIQPKVSSTNPGKSTQVYTVQPSGTRGSNKGAK